MVCTYASCLPILVINSNNVSEFTYMHAYKHLFMCACNIHVHLSTHFLICIRTACHKSCGSSSFVGHPKSCHTLQPRYKTCESKSLVTRYGGAAACTGRESVRLYRSSDDVTNNHVTRCGAFLSHRGTPNHPLIMIHIHSHKPTFF